ncbi:MAG: hypothetical protein DRP45_11355 [Candidatus Zixiibacteriota bacterium]|nr:MAG: hypothetical protein DRP45_11355 [candidate division Zixibacteria bacterium]
MSGKRGGEEMNIFAVMTERVRRFTIFDVKLVQGAAIAFALIIVKLIPDIMELDILWFVVMAVVLALRPMYVFLKSE